MMSGSDEGGGRGVDRPGVDPVSGGQKRTDESWKEKAREEKEKLAERPKEAPEELPPASFLGLLDELSYRVMMALGQVRLSGTDEVYVDLEAAKYAIDLLGILQEKTKGNLGREEETALTHVLHDLRLLFVHVSRAVATAPRAAPEAPAEPPEEKPRPKIIL
jgi:hypothetical protein